MTNGNFGISEPVTPDKLIASYVFTEEELSKLLQRVTLSTSTGVEIDFSQASAVYGRSATYETVAASQTNQKLGGAGASGDTIEGLLVIPATTSPGAVGVRTGGNSTTVFAGGASSVSNLVPFFVPLLNIAAGSGGWEVTTGANVSCVAFGSFT